MENKKEWTFIFSILFFLAFICLIYKKGDSWKSFSSEKNERLSFIFMIDTFYTKLLLSIARNLSWTNNQTPPFQHHPTRHVLIISTICLSCNRPTKSSCIQTLLIMHVYKFKSFQLTGCVQPNYIIIVFGDACVKYTKFAFSLVSGENGRTQNTDLITVNGDIETASLFYY